jgi:ATP-dependent exoDNAse (exonuclease V) alpha subunit
MITINLWQQAGIFNGLTGIIYDIIYSPGTKPPQLPLAVIVQVDERYKGPSLLPNVQRLVPLTPLQLGFEFRSKQRWRKQLTLMLAWARTIHKSQGMTLDKIVVDLSGKESCAGLTYVALSRVNSLQNLLLVPVENDRFHQLKKKKELQHRLKEVRLQRLAELTVLRYSNITAKSSRIQIL